MLIALQLLRRVTLLLTLSALLAVTACTKDEESPPVAAPAGTGPIVTISGNRFDMPPTVEPGATITVRNKDAVEHSVTSELTVLFDVRAAAGQSVTFTAPASPGSYPLYCRNHPTMRGTLVVAFRR